MMKCDLKTAAVLILIMATVDVQAERSISQHGITWEFDRDYPTGQYANGDWWVAGPVKIINITNQWRTQPVEDYQIDGAMINPTGSIKQGYDGRFYSYNASLDRARPNGHPVADENPLLLETHSSLVTSAGWVTGEPGCPNLARSTAAGPKPNIPRPAARSMAILTCVDQPPPEGSFRPPYCGTDKSPRFNVSQLDRSRLKNFAPPASTPPLQRLEQNFAGPWIDHVTTWDGSYLHPDMHMPNYAREMSILIGEAALMLQLDFSKLPGSPSKDRLLIGFTQLGIDLAGIADTGGNWISDGGIFQGRKFPILFAGFILNDEHMKNVGQWSTGFQEDMDTFYISRSDVSLSHSSSWTPDKRAELLAYEDAHIGLPEWGIRHATMPAFDNLHWSATYRDINNQSYVGFTLAALMMDLREAWGHEALFDYVDRAVAVGPYQYKNDGYRYGSSFIGSMWKAHRKDCGPVWTPDNPADFYSPGSRK